MASSDAQAKCLMPYPTNSQNQDYCDIALKLGQVCDPNFRIRPLIGSDVYHGPYIQSANACRCSSVFYSMLGACAWCQSTNGIDSWSTFITNCSTPYLREFPAGLPGGTPVPLWPYVEDVLEIDGFRSSWIDRPQRQYGETTGISNPTSSPALSTTTSSTSTSSATVPDTAASNSPSANSSNVDGSQSAGSASKKANVGAIAGGVVAGVFVLLLISCLVLWFLRGRKRAETVPSTEKAIVVNTSPSELPVRTESGANDLPWHNGNLPGGSQAASQVHFDVPDFEPPPYQPSESGSMYTGSSQSGIQAASSSGSSYPSEKGSQVLLRPTN